MGNYCYSNGQCSIPLSSLKLPSPAPNYTIYLYVEMVGMPLILNQMSPYYKYVY